MGHLTRSLLVLMAVAAGLLAGAPAVHAGPTADRAAGCAPDEVTVVVDFGVLGGGTSVRCAAGSPSSGLDALSKAGFGYGFRPGFPGMVCTINAAPNPCNGAPADAYWSYWHAPAGGGWTYATQGAGTRRPAPGTVEGWAFGADRRPSVTPPATSTPTTAAPPPPAAPPLPAATPSPAPAAPSATPGSPGVAAAPATATADAVDEPAANGPTDTPTSSSTTTAPTPVGPTTSTATVDETEPSAELAVEPASSSGSGPVALLGLGLVAVVLTAAAWEFRRRRAR